MKRALFLLGSFAVSIFVPASLSVSAAPPSVDAGEFVLVFLRIGEHAGDVPRDERAAAMRGHFENMGRLVKEGKLLVAGPLGEPRVVPANRGIFVLDTPDVETARAWSGTDPAVKAGIFDVVALPFRASAVMRRIPDLDRAAGKRREARGEESFVGRSYVIAATSDEAAAERLRAAAGESGRVLYAGRLGAGDAAQSAFCLDVTGVEEARALAGEAGAWDLHPWYASDVLTDLPWLAAHPSAPTFALRLLPEEGRLALFRPAFAKHVDVFGVVVVATDGTPDASVVRAAHVLAQCLDNDEDGVPDVPAVVDALVEAGAFLAITSSADELASVAVALRAVASTFTIGRTLRAGAAGSGGSPPERDASIDAALEESLLLVSHGYARALPEVFGLAPGSLLTRAMDRARGGRFLAVPEEYPPRAWFHLADADCDYAEQASRYFYWSLSSRLGAHEDPSRAAAVAGEWDLPTAKLVAERDAPVELLLTGGTYVVPTRLPDGGYRR